MKKDKWEIIGALDNEIERYLRNRRKGTLSGSDTISELNALRSRISRALNEMRYLCQKKGKAPSRS